MHNILKLGVILMIYALFAGAALALVNINTMSLIEENKLKVEEEARTQVLPDIDGGFELKGEGSNFPYWIGYHDTGKKEPGGYIFVTRGNGYSSTIETMVGVDMYGKIRNAKILFQQETPGLGAKVEEIRYRETESWFTKQFKGKTVTDDIRVIKDGGNIDAVTGATISSRAVTNSINSGLVELEKTIGGGS